MGNHASYGGYSLPGVGGADIFTRFYVFIKEDLDLARSA